MIVPDTSIWIEFFRQSDPIKYQMTELLEAKQVMAIEPVFAELLYGVRSPKDKETVLSYWQVLPKVEFESGSLLNASRFASTNNYHNLGIGLMDAAIIEPALNSGYLIWTLDKRILKAIDAEKLFNAPF